MPIPTSTSIKDVSDTSIWVAQYRADETLRPDALFQDPLAARLTGERGAQITQTVRGPQYTQWSVVIRTYVIDQLIQKLVAEGADLVVNLGAGLDTRPYRLNLPANLRWLEVDQANIVALKEQKLADEKPRCNLTRLAIDLSDEKLRREFLAKAASEAKRAIVLTEGVVMYLTPENVTDLARDLHAHPSLRYWIVEYFSPEVVGYLSRRPIQRRMRNAPFRFLPRQWLEFFARLGWKPTDIRYLQKVSGELGREIPRTWIIGFWLAVSKKIRARYEKAMGFMVLERA